MITVKEKGNNWYELTIDSWIRRLIGLAPKTIMVRHLVGEVFTFFPSKGVYMNAKGEILHPLYNKYIKTLDNYRRFLLYK